MSEDSQRMATQQEIQDLLEFIGGFPQWSLLKEKCRREVVKYLDSNSRCHLRISSKQDFETIENTQISVRGIEILDDETIGGLVTDNVIVRIQLDNFARVKYVFSPLEAEDTQIQWLQCAKNQHAKRGKTCWKSCNYYQEAVKFAEKWMKKCDFQLKSIKVEMKNYPFENSKIKKFPCCKRLRICSDSLDSFDWWLQKVPEQLEDLQLLTSFETRDTFTLPSEFLESPRIMQCPEFYLWCRAGFNDEQFLKLKAQSMSFDSVSVTDRGINQFLMNWINGKGVEGFRKALLWCRIERDKDTLLEGLDAKKWDDEFEENACGFVEDFERCCGRRDCFQIKSIIDPFQSLTVSIHSDRIAIYATGQRNEYDGKVFTSYSIP